jgi:hypothetical protein
MANSLQPFSFYFAGITVDYKLAVNVIILLESRQS